MWVFVPQVPYVLNDITDYQYSICDIGLLFQIYYYRITNPVHLVNTTSSSCRLRESETEDSEASPLLRRGHNRRESNPQWWRHGHVQVLLPYILGICFVLLVGGISYIVHTRGLYNDSPPVDTSTGRVFDWKSQLLGWISAALYSEFRILRTKSAILNVFCLSWFSIPANTCVVSSALFLIYSSPHAVFSKKCFD